MTDSELILRIAAKGDGITATGRHASRAAPGDILHSDETLTFGPHHAVPPCRHFGTCGGCQLQHVDEETLVQFVHDRVANAAEGQGLVPGLIAPPAMSPPYTRRRASLKAQNGGGRAVMGFNEAGSHRLVDLKECHILHPSLFAAAVQFRNYLSKIKGKFAIGIEL